MNFKKKICIIITLIFILTFLIGFSNIEKVQASNILPCAYYDPSAISFIGTYRGTANYYDGNYMAFEATATASDGISRELIITVYIASTNTTKQYKTYTDGITRKANNISIGNGSDVVISASCSDSSVTINLDLKMYSW